MAYQDSETGIQSGQPREVYKFTGTYNDYFMTSYYTELTVDGQLYSPFTITRSPLKVGTQEEKQLALDISIPFSHPMVVEYAYASAPPQLVCEIFRVHETDLNDSVLLWKGFVTSFTVEGLVAKIRVPSLFSSILQGSAPTPRYQAPCNHILYDSRCLVSEAANRQATTVVNTSLNVVEVASNSFTESDLLAGMIRQTSSGEARMITAVTGTSITVTYPFSNLADSDAIDIIRGCDHSFPTCVSKFANGTNFGGFPLVPERNPFTSKI